MNSQSDEKSSAASDREERAAALPPSVPPAKPEPLPGPRQALRREPPTRLKLRLEGQQDGGPAQAGRQKSPLPPVLGREILDRLGQPLLVLEPAPRVVFANRAFYRAFGLEESEVVGRSFFELDGGRWEGEPLRRLLEAALAGPPTDSRAALEQTVEGADRRRLTLRAERLPETGPSALLLTVLEQAVPEAAGEQSDSADGRSEQRLRTSLSEVHHRVKNNIASIGALARLEAAGLSEPAARKAFERLSTRIESFSTIYELLTVADQRETVELMDYLTRLCDKLQEVASGALDASTIELTGDSLEVSVDNAVALGVSLNELVTNAVRHAFPEGAGGRILVSLEQGPDEIRLIVADDGVGLAPEPRPTGLGLRLVRSYIEQLGGTLASEAVPTGRGTRQVIRLPSGLAL